MTGNRVIKAVLILAVVGAAVGLLIRFNAVQLPTGPVSIVWDREACAHCSMHIGEPSFAAQLQLADGEILNFDDPGCLFELLAKEAPEVHAVYFRNHARDGWLGRDEAAFVPVEPTPMGYGIAAVEKGTEGSHDWAWAKERVLEKRHARNEGM